MADTCSTSPTAATPRPEPAIIELPRITDPRGDLTFAQCPGRLPFEPKRVYWLYNVPSDSERGGHAHRDCKELLVALSGYFKVHIDDGHSRRTFTLNRPYQALYIPESYWRELDNFTSGSVCLVIASTLFDEAEYIRSYHDFLQYVHDNYE